MPLLLLALVVVPLVELYVLIQVGQAIGALWTVALLFAGSILGGVLMRSQGRLVWRRFREALASGRPPAKEVVDGGLVIFGGALLLTPGFVTDAFGIALLAPPTRAVIRRVLLRGVLARLLGPAGIPVGMAYRTATRSRPPRPGAGHRPGGTGPGASPVVDGTAREIDPREQP